MVKVPKSQPKKYLPHNKIIKATFFEDAEKKTSQIEETSTIESTLKKPDEDVHHEKKVYFDLPQQVNDRSPRSKLMKSTFDDAEETKLFQKNLERIRRKQFSIQPRDYLSGFSPLQQNYEATKGKLVEDLEHTRNMETKMEQRTSSVTKPTTTTGPLSQSVNVNIDNNLSERKSDLLEPTNRSQGINNLLQSILQKNSQKINKFKSNDNNRNSIQESFIKERIVSPVQSIKDNLFSRFLKLFRREPKAPKKSKKEQRVYVELDRQSKKSPIFKLDSKAEEDKIEETQSSLSSETESRSGRLPQDLLFNIGRRKLKEAKPISSQDSYKKFLKKLEQTNGRNES